MDKTNLICYNQNSVSFKKIINETATKLNIDEDKLANLLDIFYNYLIEKLSENDEFRFKQFTFKICRESLIVENRKRFNEKKNGVVINNHDILFLRMNPKKNKYFVLSDKMKSILDKFNRLGYSFELNPYKYGN